MVNFLNLPSSTHLGAIVHPLYGTLQELDNGPIIGPLRLGLYGLNFSTDDPNLIVFQLKNSTSETFELLKPEQYDASGTRYFSWRTWLLRKNGEFRFSRGRHGIWFMKAPSDSNLLLSCLTFEHDGSCLRLSGQAICTQAYRTGNEVFCPTFANHSGLGRLIRLAYRNKSLGPLPTWKNAPEETISEYLAGRYLTPPFTAPSFKIGSH